MRPQPTAIDPAELVPMDMFEKEFSLRIDLAYARADAFCGSVYRHDARLWLHLDLARIVLLASRLCHEKHGLRMVVYDGLRPVEAQTLMLDCPAVRAHPHWIEGDDRVLAPPGLGGHPRAMAVDVSLETKDGNLLNMGTAFDEFPEGGSGADTNRAHRLYRNLPETVLKNRQILEASMLEAAQFLKLPLLPLPVEWWDFRFPKEIIEKFLPLSDADLPQQMRMTATQKKHPGQSDLPQAHFDEMKENLVEEMCAIRGLSPPASL